MVRHPCNISELTLFDFPTNQNIPAFILSSMHLVTMSARLSRLILGWLFSIDIQHSAAAFVCGE
jgi:hypothetical protein